VSVAQVLAAPTRAEVSVVPVIMPSMEIRTKEPTVLGPAESTYDDWKGTACAENSKISSGDLYALAGLDGERHRWHILGIEMDAHSHGAQPTWVIRIYAADWHELGIQSFEDYDRVAALHGGIPVVDIVLHDATPDDVLKCMKLFGVQLRNGHLQHELIHSAYADHPEQE